MLNDGSRRFFRFFCALSMACLHESPTSSHRAHIYSLDARLSPLRALIYTPLGMKERARDAAVLSAAASLLFFGKTDGPEEKSAARNEETARRQRARDERASLSLSLSLSHSLSLSIYIYIFIFINKGAAGLWRRNRPRDQSMPAPDGGALPRLKACARSSRPRAISTPSDANSRRSNRRY